jgi:hypothetical protein
MLMLMIMSQFSYKNFVEIRYKHVTSRYDMTCAVILLVLICGLHGITVKSQQSLVVLLLVLRPQSDFVLVGV